MIGQRIYYDINTGNVIYITSEISFSTRIPTVDEDFLSYKLLSERNKETVGMLQLDYGQFKEDFRSSNGIRVNVETKELEFSYPDPNEPEAPQEFRKPLSLEIERLKQEDLNNKEAIAELYLLSMGGF